MTDMPRPMMDVVAGGTPLMEAAPILVVDDEPMIRCYVVELLRDAGYRADAVATAAAALAWIDACRPALILLDVVLPDLDGLALCRQLKADPKTGDVPVIFLTAKGNDAEMVNGLQAGGVDYIVKPFDRSVLLARVATHTTLARLSQGLAAALAERTAGLEDANQRLQALNLEMAMVEERERRRLAQQLHDTTIQQLVLARMLLDGLTGDGAGRDKRLRELVDCSLRQLRTVVFELSPPLLHQSRLGAALDWLAEVLETQWDLPIACEVSGHERPLPEATAVILFQGARELLVNAAKHARATALELTLRYDSRGVEIEVCDDGIGLNPAQLDDPAAPAFDAGGGFGLYNLRFRIERLGGRVDIAAGSPGTRVRLTVPLDAEPLPEQALTEQPQASCRN